MKYLALLTILFALSGCDEAPTTVVNDPRFSVSTMPMIRTPAGYPDLLPLIIRDVKSGAEYLVLENPHGVAITKLDLVPAATAEKP